MDWNSNGLADQQLRLIEWWRCFAIVNGNTQMNIAITGWKLLVLLFLNFRKIWYTMHFHTLVSKHNIMASSEIDLDTNRQNQKVKLKFYIL